MTDEEKDELVKEVMEGFDFETAYYTIYLIRKGIHKMPTIEKLKEQAEKLLRMALDHTDREFWWSGGMHRGGLCAAYDDKWGLSLNYIMVAYCKRI